MNVIFTCGGTAGHVNPALALAGYMKEKHPDARFLFVGTPDGIEKGLVESAGYDYAGIEVSNFLRKFSADGIRHNLHTAKTLVTSRSEANRILKSFIPDLVIGTGGYASFPIIRAAAAKGIPTAVHESNMIPGLTTKMLEDKVDKIMVGFEDCRAHYKHPEKVEVTGTPVRGDFFTLTKQEARDILKIPQNFPLVVSFWGSLGASTMNEKMVDYFEEESRSGYPFHHIHAAGKGSWDMVQHAMKEKKLSHSRLDVREYIHDMPLVMRSADLVICRAGASTISELTALGMPAVMVPSPFVVANHQEKNARILEKHGGAVVLPESEVSGKRLYQETVDILSDPQRLSSMSHGMASLGILDATERIYNTVMGLIK